MANIFDIDYGLTWEFNYPPKLRKPKALAWGRTLTRPMQWLRDLVFDDYADGASSTYTTYSSLSAYTAGQRVFDNPNVNGWVRRSVFENLTGSTGVGVQNTNNWLKVLDNYRGARERVRDNAQIMVFESALNRHFQTSGIYINTVFNANAGLYMAQTSQYSSYLSSSSFQSASTQSFLSSAPLGQGSYHYIIYVPVLYLNLATSEPEVRAFAEKINLAGFQFIISGY